MFSRSLRGFARPTLSVRLGAAAVAGLIGLLSAGPATALVAPRDEAPDRRVIPRVPLAQVPDTEAQDTGGPGAASASAFRGRHPGTWRVTFDRRTGRPSLVEGEGVPLIPGRGNGMKPEAFGLASAPADLASMEPLGRAFINTEAAWLRPATGDLRLNPERSAFLEDGAIVSLDYDWLVGGVPVEGARVFMMVNHGNVIQFGQARIGAGIPSSTPALDADQALQKLFEHAGGRRDDDRVTSEPSLLFIVQPAAQAGGGSGVAWGNGVAYRLVWRAAFKRGGGSQTWSGDVDAQTGEVVAFEDANRYARVVGGIHPRTVTDPEVVRPFNNVRVFSSSASLNTGDAGTFSYSGGPVYTPLDGTFFRTYCTGCSGPERAFAFSSFGTGDLDLGVGGHDEVGNGASTPAERDSFFHLTRVRSVARKWLNIAWLNTTVQTNLNIQDTCNAFWDGSATNFFRSGGGCNNTGEISDVMYHEWGHGLDQNTNLGDGSTGEATGDINAMHVTHDSRIGPAFVTNGDPVRDTNSADVGYVARIDTLSVYCGVCAPGQCDNGVFGNEVHCEGEIYGQTSWDLAQALAAKYGYNTGWQISERLFYVSLPQADTMDPTKPQSVYSAYLGVDDDNGNLADGTPNCSLIYQAFNAHQIAGTPCAGDTPGCTRPPQPSLVATPGTGRVILDWSASAGASSYNVLRADFSPLVAYVPVGTTTGIHFEDATVEPGVTYYYVIEALTAGGCRSTIENAVAASALPDARLLVSATLLSDIPAGNRSGYADPGESIDLSLSLLNHLPSGTAPAAQATLSTVASGVTVTNAAATFGSIAPGATSTGTAFRAALSAGVVCGQNIAFTAAIGDGGSAPTVQASVPVMVGQRSSVRYFQDFEDLNDWTTVAGSPAATSGAWIVGDPLGTNWQPENDADDDPGTQCFFTGQNTGNVDATGDVDGGETIALSPVINLAGVTAARLSYKRWWGDSSLTDASDSMIVEVSGNGGTTWVAAETLGASARNLGWQPVDIRLESLVPMTANFRMRVRVKDGGTDSNVEGAIDDVMVEQVTCDLTPPCFIAPTFAGLAAAAPGASCAETDLSWAPATTSCTNAQISYSVYRSTAPGFVPAPANRVATGIAATSFHDTLLQKGATYYYIVRADDSRSGQDPNLLARSVVASMAPDTVPPVFAGLISAQSGVTCGATSLIWLPGAETCSGPPHYNVYRSTTPGFTPAPANLVASTLSTTYTDTTLVPNQVYYYKVRAADDVGNQESNVQERTAQAKNLPLNVYFETFEANNGGWTPVAPNDAVTGNWAWGDPQGTGVQPEDDATPPPGVNAWITGLQADNSIGIGAFDVDGGTTTMTSPIINLTGQPSPVLELSLFFSNDQGSNPGEDPLRVDVSGNAGASWVNVLNSLTDIAPWTARQFPLSGVVPINNQFQIRVQTQDLGVGGSVVEAGVDDVKVLQPNAGCSVCTGTVAGVGTILVTRTGDDIVVDWSADPIAATSYNVYLVPGPGSGTVTARVKAGTASTKSFVHAGGALLTGTNFYYDVTAVDSCGRETPIP